MSTPSPKRQLLEQLAMVAKTLGHPDRMEILEHLGQGERNVEALSRRLGLPVANTSHHLQQLRRAGLVVSQRHGKYVVYRPAAGDVFDLLAALRETAERGLDEVDQILRSYFHKRDGMEPVSRTELLQRTRDGLALVLDVRPEEEFSLGHVAGAVNIPVEHLEQRVAELDPEQEIVAYCRGPYCVMSFDAVVVLRDKGFSVRRLEDGYPEWEAAGLPIGTGT